MAVRKNIDFHANPAATEGMLSIRPDVCTCGSVACDYEATISSPVTAINLDGIYDGDSLDLPNAPYAVTEDGATALEADLRTVLDGLGNVRVRVDDPDSPTELNITVLNSVIELKNVNGTASFTKSNCHAPGHGDSVFPSESDSD